MKSSIKTTFNPFILNGPVRRLAPSPPRRRRQPRPWRTRVARQVGVHRARPEAAVGGDDRRQLGRAGDGVDDAVARANNSHFGLGSSIWTADLQRGADLAREIQAGTTWINSHLIMTPQQPFGGVKWSGIGVENGLQGLHEFTDVHLIYQARG